MVDLAVHHGDDPLTHALLSRAPSYGANLAACADNDDPPTNILAVLLILIMIMAMMTETLKTLLMLWLTLSGI